MSYLLDIRQIAEQENCSTEEIQWELDQIFGTEDPAIIDEMCREFGGDMTIDDILEYLR